MIHFLILNESSLRIAKNIIMAFQEEFGHIRIGLSKFGTFTNTINNDYISTLDRYILEGCHTDGFHAHWNIPKDKISAKAYRIERKKMKLFKACYNRLSNMKDVVCSDNIPSYGLSNMKDVVCSDNIPSYGALEDLFGHSNNGPVFAFSNNNGIMTLVCIYDYYRYQNPCEIGIGIVVRSVSRMELIKYVNEKGKNNAFAFKNMKGFDPVKYHFGGK